MLFVAVLFRRPLSDWRPILAVGLAAVGGEIWDIYDTLGNGGRPRWSGNIKDVCNTLFWPTVLFLLARFSSLLKR